MPAVSWTSALRNPLPRPRHSSANCPSRPWPASRGDSTAEPAFRKPTFSLIVPTRGRIEQLRRLLDSLVATAAHPVLLEVVLVVDEDDLPSVQFKYDGLSLKRVVLPPGQTMGQLNT